MDAGAPVGLLVVADGAAFPLVDAVTELPSSAANLAVLARHDLDVDAIR